MRGPDIHQETLFSTVSPEQRVPKDHPLCPIREMVNEALAKLDSDFNALYAEGGKPSIDPEKLLRAQLLKAFYTIRSDRQLMEQMDYNLLLRWFVGFSMDARSGTIRPSARTGTGCWKARSRTGFLPRC